MAQLVPGHSTVAVRVNPSDPQEIALDLGTEPPTVTVTGGVLTVLSDGQAPRQVQVGNPVPPEAAPLLYPGCNVPAKVLPEEPDGVAIDWAAAVAEFTK